MGRLNLDRIASGQDRHQQILTEPLSKYDYPAIRV